MLCAGSAGTGPARHCGKAMEMVPTIMNAVGRLAGIGLTMAAAELILQDREAAALFYGLCRLTVILTLVRALTEAFH